MRDRSFTKTGLTGLSQWKLNNHHQWGWKPGNVPQAYNSWILQRRFTECLWIRRPKGVFVWGCAQKLSHMVFNCRYMALRIKAEGQFGRVKVADYFRDKADRERPVSREIGRQSCLMVLDVGFLK